jgi:hydrogenase maturation protease
LKESGKKTLIVGLGNPLSGDDRFGAQVLELLCRKGNELPPGVSLADAHTDLLKHIEDFSGYECVVLIDTILDPAGKFGQAGRVVVLDEDAFRAWPEASQGVHQISPLLAAKLFRLFHPEAQTRIILVGLLVDRITHAPRLLTDERIQEAAVAVRALLS